MNTALPLSLSEKAITQWISLLGQTKVDTSLETCQRYAQTCSATSYEVIAVLYPESKDDVLQILPVAEQYRIPVYPLSRGKNWGYGSSSPASENNVIIDLSRMNRIVEVNSELGYAVIEPGVTQDQLYRHLKENNTGLVLDATGASPEASIVGNVLERGFGQSPYGDRFLHSSAMEVILADGSIVHTGFSHYPHAKAAHIHKWGLGPYLDGIFTQSNFGIITQLTVWLLPEPEYDGLCIIRLPNDQAVAQTIDRLRSLRMRGLLRSTLHFANDLRVLSTLRNFPYEKTKGTTPLPETLLEIMCKNHHIASWNAIGGIGGVKRDVHHTVRELRRCLRGIASVYFIPSRIGKLSKLIAQFTHPSSILRVNNDLFELMRGKPTHVPTRGVYWRKKSIPALESLQPSLDRCGVMWCSPVLPSTERDVISLMNITRQTMEEFSLETNVALSLLNERASCATVGLFYDRDDPNGDSVAQDCYHTLLDRYYAAGYIPYRYGINTSDAQKTLFRSDDTFWNVCQRIKGALDPSRIIAPGRYSIT